MKKVYLILLLSVFSAGMVEAQSIFSPNYALKSPITVEVLSIETIAGITTVNLTIENQLDEGYFCIDRNTYITTDRGEKHKLSELTGLNFCPDYHRFTHKGEIKFFTMNFPAVDDSTVWLDLVEECGDNCLAIYGLSLDPALNDEINECFRDIDNKRTGDAIEKFEAIKTSMKDSGNPILGSIYLNLITLYTEGGNTVRADELKSEFQGIILPHKEMFLDLLK